MQENIFEKIKRINEEGYEFWYAREFAKVLGYEKFDNFINVIEKAKIACEKAGQKSKEHIAEVGESLLTGNGVMREFPSYKLSRYACYLIAQNGDPRKVEIAKAQTYFAIKTRQKEIEELLIEDNKRVYLREEMKEHNKNLASTAKKAGVTNYANFQDFGYMGLYGGLRQKDIKNKKGLVDKDLILDHMGSEELAANLFRATQADAKIKRENIQGQMNASLAHKEVGQKVRNTIKSLGGTMPEELPVAENIKVSKKRIKQSTAVKKIKE
jgi:DNA-damage-inducible protein D